MKKELIALVVLMILITGCSKVEKTGMQPSVEMPTEEKEEVLPQPPIGMVSLYKGFWMPCAYSSDTCQPMFDVTLQKEVGANIALLGPTVKLNSKGDTMFSGPFHSIDDVEKRLAQITKKYYKEGIRIGLVIEVFYEPEFTMYGGGEPKPIPKDIGEKSGFLNKYNLVVEDIAKLAEKYKVEMFSPMNEPDMKFDDKTASEWGQRILPIVKKHYNGKILWKSAFVNQMGNYETMSINFKGYDIIGTDPTPGGGPLENYRQDLNRMITKMSNYAKRDNVPGIMFTEFGVWGGAIGFSEEQKALAHRIAFEQGKGKVKGFIALDPPPDLDRSIKGTKSLEEIKIWFKEKL